MFLSLILNAGWLPNGLAVYLAIYLAVCVCLSHSFVAAAKAKALLQQMHKEIGPLHGRDQIYSTERMAGNSNGTSAGYPAGADKVLVVVVVVVVLLPYPATAASTCKDAASSNNRSHVALQAFQEWVNLPAVQEALHVRPTFPADKQWGETQWSYPFNNGEALPRPHSGRSL